MLAGLPEKPFYSPIEVANYLDIDWATVVGLVKTGQLRALEINATGKGKRVGSYRIYRDSLESFIESNTNVSTDVSLDDGRERAVV